MSAFERRLIPPDPNETLDDEAVIKLAYETASRHAFKAARLWIKRVNEPRRLAGIPTLKLPDYVELKFNRG